VRFNFFNFFNFFFRTLESQVSQLSKTIVNNESNKTKKTESLSVSEPDSNFSSDSCLQTLQRLQDQLENPTEGFIQIIDDDFSPLSPQRQQFSETSDDSNETMELDIFEDSKLDENMSIPLIIFQKLMKHQVLKF
jgi:hypothetical protein